MRVLPRERDKSEKAEPSGAPRHNAATPAPDRNEQYLLFLQRTVGNQAVQQLLKSGTEEGVEAGTNVAGTGAQSAVEQALGSTGQPLDEGSRATMEPLFGHGFGEVRVHDDPAAASSANAIRARAYTVGRHIFFGAGQYAPGTTRGSKLLAHELAHVVQQDRAGGAAAPQLDSEVSTPQDASEKEAGVAAERVTAGEKAEVRATPTSLIHRDGDELPAFLGYSSETGETVPLQDRQRSAAGRVREAISRARSTEDVVELRNAIQQAMQGGRPGLVPVSLPSGVTLPVERNELPALLRAAELRYEELTGTGRISAALYAASSVEELTAIHASIVRAAGQRRGAQEEACVQMPSQEEIPVRRTDLPYLLGVAERLLREMQARAEHPPTPAPAPAPGPEHTVPEYSEAQLSATSDFLQNAGQEMLTEWFTIATNAARDAQAPDDPVAARNFNMALAGNLIWAATSLFPSGRFLTVAASFAGAVVGSGSLAQPASATGVPMVNERLALARDRLEGELATLIPQAVSVSVSRHLISDRVAQRRILWSLLFPDTPYEGRTAALYSSMRDNIRAALASFLEQYQPWRAEIEQCAYHAAARRQVMQLIPRPNEADIRDCEAQHPFRPNLNIGR